MTIGRLRTGIGVIGAGFMARTWAECALRSDRAVLRAVFGGRRASALAADYAVTEEPSMTALLARADIQAVVITSPPNAHAEQTIMAARAGKNVLVEKPMARNSSDAERMVRACADAGVTLAVVSQHRFRAAQLRARELIRDGAIGKLRMIRLSGINRWWDFTTNGDAWKIDPDHMNVFHDWGSHACDVLRFQIAAEPVRVVAESTSYTGDPAHQSTMAIFTFGNGVLANLWMTYEAPEPRFDSAIKLMIVGSAGMLDVDSYAGVRLGRDGEWRQDFRQPAFDPLRPDDPVRLEAYQREFADFLNACTTGHPAEVTGQDGLMCLRMLEAALTSARTHGAVELTSAGTAG
jgi:UDP-N-acetyl-2-amino-2-deoxyglucuronate dehydrogenase